MMAHEQQKICAVCGYQLGEVRHGSAALGWIHSRPGLEDHPVVAVDNDGVMTNDVCDFCERTPVTMVLLAHSFEFLIASQSAALRSLGPWVACERCAGLAELDQWFALATRVHYGASAARHIPLAELQLLYEEIGRRRYGMITIEEWRRRSQAS